MPQAGSARIGAMSARQRVWRNRILVALALFAVGLVLDKSGALRAWFGQTGAVYASFVIYLVPYVVSGYDVVWLALRSIINRQPFDEHLLMTIATLGAFALVLFPQTDPHMAEGAAVMLFYQVGELFQSYAVGRSRRSIADMMDIAPEFANVERDGQLVQVDPEELSAGDVFVVKPGERIPLDGVVERGQAQVDTAALTGESVPRAVGPGSQVISGCVDMSGLLYVRATKPYAESTVSRVLELVENASDKKARTESLITRFARVYTPAVTGLAALVAVVPPLLTGQPWADWVVRALTFLVVSCPCALVISVPLSFFGGIGGSSRMGVLIKGGNYLEALARVDTVVFDKTGTLTNGSFGVIAVHSDAADEEPAPDEKIVTGPSAAASSQATTPGPNAAAISQATTSGQNAAASGSTASSATAAQREVLRLAAHAEAFSNHPLAASVRDAYLQTEPNAAIDQAVVGDVSEQGGHGVSATVGGRRVLVGNERLLRQAGVEPRTCTLAGTTLHVAADGAYEGHVVVADAPKANAARAIHELHNLGVRRTVMLTGDREEVAADIAGRLGIDQYRAQLLPQDKVEQVELLMQERQTSGQHGALAFVGDGINDAPSLTRADVGIAMGAMGSDAAIEAADVVLMDDDPAKIPAAMRVARKTMRIAWQNIVFALGVKVAILILAALGIAGMWAAVFGDVGVAVLAILNAMRCMDVRKMAA